MKEYRINFNNKITKETVTIRYKVLLDDPEHQKSIAQFGSAAFQRFSTPEKFFLTGQAALEMIGIINNGMTADYRLKNICFASSQDQTILQVPAQDDIIKMVHDSEADPTQPLPEINIVKQNLIG
ncbi:hypothetical protein [Secundilactobacillus malefermentans]|uniref:hypothetical protein n=1 Tax=Secundilactobacillus malefermentans TaxID=176292 RepID=UPI0011C9B5FC|nr:hypothetical protein [Secundilactobacillus malefermentans]QEA31290.1 hypothetical protein FGL90_03375 [Secundilactobacillus malefermentans]